MGTDTGGGMIIGAHASLVDFGEDLWEYLDEHGMSSLSPYYDSGYDVVIGFIVDDVLVTDMGEEWLLTMRSNGRRFENITGVSATLIGMQDVG